MSRNREIAEAFAAGFAPPLAVVKTQRINNVPHRDAWLVAAYDTETGAGVTAHAYGGQLHAYIEVLAGAEAAANIGRRMAAAMGRLKQDAQRQVHEGDGEGSGVGAPAGDAQPDGNGEEPGQAP